MMEKEMQLLKKRVVKMFLACMDTRKGDKYSLRRFDENIRYFSDVITESKKDCDCIFLLYSRSRNTSGLNPQEFTLIGVFYYLLVVEGVICNVLNFITYLLVALEHDLYTITKRKYIKEDIEEIRKVEMSTKIQFLKHHEFGVLTKEHDSTFRNDIAHHNYRVDEKGILWVRGKPVDFYSKAKSVGKMLNFSAELFKELATVIKTNPVT